MNDYRKFIKVIGMAVLIVSMLGGSVFAAERVAVRSAESSTGGNGFGIYVPVHYLLPVAIKDAITAESLGDEDITLNVGGQKLTGTAGSSLYTPDLLLGYKIDIRGDAVEPVVGLYYLSSTDGGTRTMLGFAGGAKYYHTFVRGSIGNVYGGGTALLQFASTSVKDSYDTSVFGLSIIGNLGVEIFPFESLKKFGLTFDTGIPLLAVLSYGFKPNGGTTESVTRINFLERLPVFSLGMHIYF